MGLTEKQKNSLNFKKQQYSRFSTSEDLIETEEDYISREHTAAKSIWTRSTSIPNLTSREVVGENSDITNLRDGVHEYQYNDGTYDIIQKLVDVCYEYIPGTDNTWGPIVGFTPEVIDIVPHIYGTGYFPHAEAKLVDESLIDLSAFSADWVYDCPTGKLRFYNDDLPPGLSLSTKIYVTVYKYIGPNLDNFSITGIKGAQGFQGAPNLGGPTGPTGPQGTGPQGNQGIAGAAAATGATGVQGQQGGLGDRGFQGWQGVQGWQGAIGLSGYQGLTGSAAATGAQGNQGWQGNDGAGAQGNQGWQGFQGNQGNQGEVGFQGNQGNQGVRGPQGNQGNQGWQGNQGIKGNQGNEGTAAATGAQGNQGWQGVVGPQGNQGAEGTAAATGAQGNQGWQGGIGFQGLKGNQGVPGPQGIQGPIGVQGNQGWQGGVGPQGNQGAEGPQGWQGNQGDFGPQGYQGLGVQGVPGPQGTPGDCDCCPDPGAELDAICANPAHPKYDRCCGDGVSAPFNMVFGDDALGTSSNFYNDVTVTVPDSKDLYVTSYASASLNVRLDIDAASLRNRIVWVNKNKANPGAEVTLTFNLNSASIWSGVLRNETPVGTSTQNNIDVYKFEYNTELQRLVLVNYSSNLTVTVV